MAVLKCKMCGGELAVQENSYVCVCEYCGSQQTVPSVDDEKKVKLFERANSLRLSCEFDRALGVYESIVEDFSEEAEAYFGILLCKYGIEYVDDPKTKKKIPTCHRSSFDSIFDDKAFDMVMETADVVARGVYREQAKEIEEIRKGIIEKSSKEEPYDIFICYKESDDKGDRTIDSVIAQDIYSALTKEGYRVFFARITLESKLGCDYEPIIFSALHSSKVMLCVGTSYDYYHAVWVKNEWSRYLKLIEAGENKTLIPCFKNIDAYDLPKEFKHLQAQDMSKVGSIQDLVRGIEKIITKKETVKAAESSPSLSSFAEPLVTRGMGFLKDKDFDKASGFFEKALDYDPSNENALLGSLLVAYKMSSVEELISGSDSYVESKEYKALLSSCSAELKEKFERGLKQAKESLKKEADGAFNDASYESAKKSYQRIIKLGEESEEILIKLFLCDCEAKSIEDIKKPFIALSSYDLLVAKCSPEIKEKLSARDDVIKEKYLLALERELQEKNFRTANSLADTILNSWQNESQALLATIFIKNSVSNLEELLPLEVSIKSSKIGNLAYQQGSEKLRERIDKYEKELDELLKIKRRRKKRIIAITAACFAVILIGVLIWFLTLERIEGFEFVSQGDGYAVVKYTGSGSEVVIPKTFRGKPVVTIYHSAFSGCTSLTSITIPNSVTSIGVFAFEYCTSLTSINIPNSVTSIGSSAFRGCTSLTSITIGDSVTSIDNYAFYGCSGLTSITIPNSVTSIGSSAFEDCTGLTSINIPNSVTSIGNSAFYGCTSLTIYCEAKSKPRGWNSYWNADNCPVVWGYKEN